VISLGIIFVIAAVQNPSGWGRHIYAALVLLAAAGGMGVAGRHAWIQSLPADQVPSCGPGLNYILDSFPLLDALKMVFTGSGECADVVWEFLGLSMPAWVFICLAVVGAFGMWNNLRRV